MRVHCSVYNLSSLKKEHIYHPIAPRRHTNSHRILKMQQKIIFTINVLILLWHLSGASAAPDTTTNEKNATNFSFGDHERTLILLKPDSIQRGLIGRIIQRFEDKGFKLVAMKFILAPKDLVEKHYESHANSYYFSGLVEYMTSGPIIPLVLEGWNAVKLSRRMLGPPDSLESLPGTIRGDFSVHFGLSVIHGSHSIEEADREIPIWFGEQELISWSQANKDWIQP